MSATSRVVASVTALFLLAGCASQASLDALAITQQQYTEAVQRCESGEQAVCAVLPNASASLLLAQQQVATEKQESGAVAAAVILLPLVILAAGAGGGGNYHGGGWGHHGGWHHY